MRITIEVPDGLYAELLDVSAAEANDLGYGVASWVEDIVASALADRRLRRNGARVIDKPAQEGVG